MKTHLKKKSTAYAFQISIHSLFHFSSQSVFVLQKKNITKVACKYESKNYILHKSNFEMSLNYETTSLTAL